MRSRTFKVFLRGHHYWLTVIGTLIVFFTFIVNDVLRDRLRETASSIASAQNVLSVRRDIWKLSFEQQFMESLLEGLVDKMRSLPGSKRSSAVSVESKNDDSTQAQIKLISSEMRFEDQIDSGVMESLDLASQLIRGMPEDEKTTAELKSIAARWVELSKSRSDIGITVVPFVDESQHTTYSIG